MIKSTKSRILPSTALHSRTVRRLESLRSGRLESLRYDFVHYAGSFKDHNRANRGERLELRARNDQPANGGSESSRSSRLAQRHFIYFFTAIYRDFARFTAMLGELLAAALTHHRRLRGHRRFVPRHFSGDNRAQPAFGRKLEVVRAECQTLELPQKGAKIAKREQQTVRNSAKGYKADRGEFRFTNIYEPLPTPTNLYSLLSKAVLKQGWRRHFSFFRTGNWRYWAVLGGNCRDGLASLGDGVLSS